MATEDLNNHKDLQEHLINFSLIVDQFNTSKTEKYTLTKALERTTLDVENLRTSEKTLTEQLQILTKTCQNEESVYLLYVKLKDKYVDLEKKCKYLMEQNNSLQEKSLVEVTALEENFKRDKNKLLFEFNQKLKNYEEQQLAQRHAFSKKGSTTISPTFSSIKLLIENELYNELQLLRTTNGIQCDEMQATEKSLRSQLKDVVDSYSALRQEHLLLKTRNQSELEAAKKAIDDLKSKLRYTEQQLRLNQEHLFRLNSEIETTHTVQVTSTVGNLKYDALAVTSIDTKKSQFSTNQMTGNNSHYNTIKSTIKANIPSCLPALKQLSNVPQKPKKRKLYMPGSINLQDFDEVE
ncbi:hypothetical protein FQR65_LT11686 [Abscondita terminalis]|nr:hypothetical protein FQR65_LT11686 [Abscondita terminalis]